MRRSLLLREGAGVGDEVFSDEVFGDEVVAELSILGMTPDADIFAATFADKTYHDRK